MHKPVLVKEFLSFFYDLKIKIFCDATAGACGHSKEMLKNHKEIKKFFCVDQDEEALKVAKKNLDKWRKKIFFIHANFKDLKEILDCKVDGFLFDIGLSSMQIDQGKRGFSFQNEGPLDMRMDRKKTISAFDVVNKFSQKEIEKIFKEYGQEPKYRQAAKAIVDSRKKRRIFTTFDLKNILLKACKKTKKIHPVTRCFQALRIFVNDEINCLKKGISAAFDLLSEEGRMVIISFHSIEDRIVKHFFKEKEREKLGKILTKKPLVASRSEVLANKRSRSAKLRCIEKVGT